MSEMTGTRFPRTDIEPVSSIRFAVNTTDKKQRARMDFMRALFFAESLLFSGVSGTM